MAAILGTATPTQGASELTAVLMTLLAVAVREDAAPLSAEVIYGGIMAVVAAGTLAASIYAGKRADLRQARIERLEAEERAEARRLAEERAAQERAAEERGGSSDTFEEFRNGELQRLYRRLEQVDTDQNALRERAKDLETMVRNLEDSDRSKQRKIEDQETLLGQLKGLVLRLLDRVDYAWENGHAKPTLTAAERILLDEVQPAKPQR